MPAIQQWVGAGEPTLCPREVPGPEVIEAGFGISFFAGEIFLCWKSGLVRQSRQKLIIVIFQIGSASRFSIMRGPGTLKAPAETAL